MNKFKTFIILTLSLSAAFFFPSSVDAEDTPAQAIRNDRFADWIIVKSDDCKSYKEGVFTYKYYESKDGKSVWIHRIALSNTKAGKNLVIPSQIDGKTVTKLGFEYIPGSYFNESADDSDDDFIEGGGSIFGGWSEQFHDCDASCVASNSIDKMTIPDTVTDITATAFSGMNNLKSVVIPDNVKDIPYEMFYGCDNLKKVTLPANMESFDPDAFNDCPKLRIMKLAENSHFKIKDKCIVNKEDKSLVFNYASGSSYKIPKGIKIIKTASFTNCTAKKIYIPASVKVIEAKAFNIYYGLANKYIKDISVSKRNKVYAKDGQTIYNKKDRSLTVAIVDKNGVFKMSNKVKRLDENQSLVGIDEFDYGIIKAVISKNLKQVKSPYAFNCTGTFGSAKKVYFTGTKMPKLLNQEKNHANLPVFCDLYVPKKALNKYKAFYKKSLLSSFVDSWHTF